MTLCTSTPLCVHAPAVREAAEDLFHVLAEIGGRIERGELVAPGGHQDVESLKLCGLAIEKARKAGIR